MSKQKNCPHKIFELSTQGMWACQSCKESFSAEEVESIMVSRRQGFDMLSLNKTKNEKPAN